MVDRLINKLMKCVAYNCSVRYYDVEYSVLYSYQGFSVSASIVGYFVGETLTKMMTSTAQALFWFVSVLLLVSV